MSYPSRLIPDKNKHQIENPLNSKENLCRWVDPVLPFREIDGSLAGGAVANQDSHIFDFITKKGYSTNKIPPAEINDIFIKFHDTNYFNQKWQEGTDGATVEENDFIWLEEGNYFFMEIGDFNYYQGIYPYPAYPENKEKPNCKFLLVVNHDPLIANIAHCEFFITAFDEKGEEVDKPGKGSRKLLISEIRQRIVKKAKFEFF